VILL
jgi:hypothetical protein